MLQGPSTESAQFVLDLENISVQAQQLSTKSGATVTSQFDVASDTSAIAIAHTDLTDGPYNEGRSLFRYPMRSGDVTKNQVVYPWSDAVGKAWTAFQILFDGRQWPQQLADPLNKIDHGGFGRAGSGNAGGEGYDFLDEKATNYYQFYQDHAAHTGQLYNPAGPEDYDNWVKSGVLLFTSWPRANSNATRLQLQERFLEPDKWSGQATLDVLIFTKFRKAYLINIVNGRVMRVETPQNNTDGSITG